MTQADKEKQNACLSRISKWKEIFPGKLLHPGTYLLSTGQTLIGIHPDSKLLKEEQSFPSQPDQWCCKRHAQPLDQHQQVWDVEVEWLKSEAFLGKSLDLWEQCKYKCQYRGAPTTDQWGPELKCKYKYKHNANTNSNAGSSNSGSLRARRCMGRWGHNSTWWTKRSFTKTIEIAKGSLYECYFLASQDALEVMRVPYSLTNWVSEWAFSLTLLM